MEGRNVSLLLATFQRNVSFGDFISCCSNALTLLTNNIIKFNFQTGHATKKVTNNFFFRIFENNLFILDSKTIIIIVLYHVSQQIINK